MTFSCLTTKEAVTRPFRYFLAPQAFTSDLSLLMLEWLETSAPWKLVEASFYEQYEISLLDVALPPILACAFSRENITTLRRTVEAHFEVALKSEFDLTVHRLVAGQRIRIHNDYIPGRETHRVLIQLNRGWSDDNGGALMFFNSQSPSDVARIFRPVHNSCVAFEISPQSLHAVSTIYSGDRFTLVFSFYREQE